MAATLILWGHALAALLFGALALAEHRRAPVQNRPRAGLIVGLVLTALWALAVAGIDANDVSTRLAQSARSVAWLWVVVVLARQEGAAGRSVVMLTGVVGVVLMTEAMLSAFIGKSIAPQVLDGVAATRALLAATATTGALLVLSHFAQTPGARRSGDRRMLVLALAVMWSIDLAVDAAAAFQPYSLPVISALRGPAMAAAALLLAAAGADRGLAPPTVSRSLVMRSLALLALVLYAGLTALVAGTVAAFAGQAARAAQTVVVFAFTAALLAFASTPWLRAWMRVKVAKHLFGHRYDYRIEWQRFTTTLGLPGEGADPLGTRIVKALADLTDSPAGLLLVLDGSTITTTADWRWHDGDRERAAHPSFARYLATGRILSLDAMRSGQTPEDEGAAVPRWLIDDPEAWAVVPLLHGGDLIGAIVLARPPVDRALDWEDFDLLRVVGRQTASYLAEERAHAALADAQRFDEFNRRFAFLMHDIKNVASQLTLVARNAERHADNPDFRADMLATLRDSAGRMTTLLARLGQHDGARPEALQAVDLAALVRRVVAARRAQHPIAVDAPGACLAIAQPARLEQALGHLLQNAVEASAGGTPVTVAVHADLRSILIEVADRGGGMSAGFIRDQLFRPFASSKPTGFGIGAYEARQLVQAMDGTIDVESREGEGTRFRIRLPAAAPVSLPLSPLEAAA